MWNPWPLFILFQRRDIVLQLLEAKYSNQPSISVSQDAVSWVQIQRGELSASQNSVT
jgi:hypothetical protein